MKIRNVFHKINTTDSTQDYVEEQSYAVRIQRTAYDKSVMGPVTLDDLHSRIIIGKEYVK